MASPWKKVYWVHRASVRKTEEPPKTYEEFLKFQNWDYWPRDMDLDTDNTWESDLKKIKEDNTFTSIYSYLWNNVPRVFEAGCNIESRLKDCSRCLEEHASKLFEWNFMTTKRSKPSFLYAHEKFEKYKLFLQKYRKEKKIMLSDEMKTRKNIQGSNFPGFKISEITQLPRHVDAKRIYLFILKSNVIEEKLRKIWKYHFLSEASINLLHDCFWWWFLYKFKPDRKNQDCLFDRISEIYVVLFLSIPLSRKDAFLQVYPDCLAQAICAAFYESFPESTDLFNDEFKEDLGNTIYLWLTGVKPPKAFWTHWNVKDLTTATVHGIKRAPTETLMKRITRSQERLTKIDFNIGPILENPRNYKRMEVKEVRTSAPTIKSHYRSFGPEFCRILFNSGGQSPLILYYLKKHEPTGKFITARSNKFKITEIAKEPYPFLYFAFMCSASELLKTQMFQFKCLSLKRNLMHF
ncbi:protein FAM227B [Perognathus longimembris pacificus]|uniref:protein FAM227B n=1 Tax=Perognathus longimembris pacificus TaxID=214514 RepID=UPI0020187B45|nr:protein FAM227B [Perognathus longimembris pacificus]